MKRPANKLSFRLEHHVNAYALAASAAGVGVLALIPPAEYTLPASAALAGLFAFSEPAEARIVYTATSKNISCFVTRNSRAFCKPKLDLNHDKNADFKFTFVPSDIESFGISPVGKKNEIWTTTSRSGGGAAALYSGAIIQSATNFKGGHARMFSVYLLGRSQYSWGPWADVQNRYLGLKFLIKGKVHYGWARLSTTKFSGNPYATLTGYAYETIPNKSIIAGKTKGKDVIAVEPASLGHLARGASGLSAWRKESAGVTH